MCNLEIGQKIIYNEELYEVIHNYYNGQLEVSKVEDETYSNKVKLIHQLEIEKILVENESK